MQKTINLGLCLLGYFLFGMAIVIYSGHVRNIMFVWNVFLAFLPIVFVQILKFYRGRGFTNKIVMGMLLFLWLLFFPNAHYVVTDMIYFGDTSYFVGNELSATYTTSILPWIKIIYIGGGILLGTFFGLDSLFDVHMFINEKKGRAAGNLAVFIVSLLSGYAIYIGRILRVNSWDVLHPFSLLDKIIDDISRFSILFSLIFSAYILGTYFLYRAAMTGRKP